MKRSDDHFVRAYHRLLPVYLRQGPDVKRLHDAFADSPQLLRACEAQLLHVEIPTLRADIVKAKLLAGQSNEEIAKESNLHPDAVEYFEKIFFNVRDRLGCSSWINVGVLRPAERLAVREGASSAQQHAYVYLSIAYNFGSKALEFMLEPGKFNDVRKSDPGAWLAKQTELELMREGLIAAMVKPVNFEDRKWYRDAIGTPETADIAADKELDIRMLQVVESVLMAMNGTSADAQQCNISHPLPDDAAPPENPPGTVGND